MEEGYSVETFEVRIQEIGIQMKEFRLCLPVNQNIERSNLEAVIIIIDHFTNIYFRIYKKSVTALLFIITSKYMRHPSSSMVPICK